jgi:uncharacterized protein
MAGGRIILAGGSGFLGRSLAEHLTRRGREVFVLTRAPKGKRGAVRPVREVAWDGRTVGDWARLLEGAEAVFNLAGRSVNCRYTRANRREIVESRVRSVGALGEAILGCAQPPRVLVQAASAAIYGDAGARICDESAPAGSGFSAETCVRWEAAFDAPDLPNTRKVLLRIGFVLGRGGGALGTLVKLTRAYLGGTVGGGRQYVSWLHAEDMNRIFLWAVERGAAANGTFNATGPAPVPNAEFMEALRRALRRPWSPPVPAGVVRLGAALMLTEAELALTGRRCLPERLIEDNFKFLYTSLDEALRDLFARELAHDAAHTPANTTTLR